jgi:cytochrome aa3-600 menaquinol oxidase subunit 2
MQSFWVPALGGQKYSMNKMETELYLVADNPGSYMGRNTNFNGRGYAQMEFEVLAQTDQEYDAWVKEVKETAPKLTEEKYMELLKPTHLGRLTYNNTHLAWINHADPDAELVTDPEDYRYHGYQGKIFDQEEQSSEESNQVENNEEDHGGDHSGH